MASKSLGFSSIDDLVESHVLVCFHDLWNPGSELMRGHLLKLGFILEESMQQKNSCGRAPVPFPAYVMSVKQADAPGKAYIGRSFPI